MLLGQGRMRAASKSRSHDPFRLGPAAWLALDSRGRHLSDPVQSDSEPKCHLVDFQHTLLYPKLS